jgi:hypothetical protein
MTLEEVGGYRQLMYYILFVENMGDGNYMPSISWLVPVCFIYNFIKACLLRASYSLVNTFLTLEAKLTYLNLKLSVVLVRKASVLVPDTF